MANWCIDYIKLKLPEELELQKSIVPVLFYAQQAGKILWRERDIFAYQA